MSIEVEAAAPEAGEGPDLISRLRRAEAELARLRGLLASRDRFSAVLAGSPIFVYEMDADLRYRWVCNPPPPLDPADWIGRRDDETAPFEHAAPRMALKRGVIETGQGVRAEVTHLVGAAVHSYDLTLEPVRDAGGRVIGLTGAALDITPRKQAEAALQASESRFRLLARASSEAVWEWDIARDRVFWGDNLAAVIGRSPEEIRPVPADDMDAAWARWDALIHPDDRERACASLRHAIERRAEFWAEEYRFSRPDGYAWLSERDCLVYDEAGRLVRMIGAVRDITERKTVEARQQLLLHELSHRVKNTLAVVQGIVRQSLSGERSLAEAREVLTRRVRALAATHALLTASAWHGAPLRSVLAGELAPHGNRAALDGPEVMLTPKAALALAMILHELATNATKYGALAVPQGRVEVGWTIGTAAGPEPALHLTWRERNGPPVAAPLRSGFGRMLIEQGLAHELGGQARLEFRSAGLVCELVVPAGDALVEA